jgi:WD40 repeat protein
VVVAGGGVEEALANLQLKDHHDHDTEDQLQLQPQPQSQEHKLTHQEASSIPPQLVDDEQEAPPPRSQVVLETDTTSKELFELDWKDDSHEADHDLLLEPNPIDLSQRYEQQAQQLESLSVFTDEELVAALISSLDDGNDDDHRHDDLEDNPNYNPSGALFGGGSDLLPDIQVDFDDDLDDFLAPDQLDSVFDNHNGNQEAEEYSPADDHDDDDENRSIPKDPTDETPTYEYHQAIESRTLSLPQEQDDQEQDYDASHPLQLELANLSLGEYDDWNPEIPDDWDIIGGTDGLPPYMYCQPCAIQPGDPNYFEQLQQLLPPIEEDEPLSDQRARLERQSIEQGRPDVDDLPSQLDLLNLGTTQDEEEFSQGMDNPELEERHETLADPIRKQAIEAAKPFWEAFGLGDEKSKERSCLGHKETIFGLSFSQDGNYCATASQDSTVNIWNVEKNVRVSVLTEHSKDYECLRATWASSDWSADVLDRSQGATKHLLASGGADGTVKLWGCDDPKKGDWKCHATLDHSKLGKRGEEKKKREKEGDTEGKEDVPQVYATAFIDHWKAFTTTEESSTTATQNSFLMTSSDDYIHFWEIEATPSDQQIQLLDRDVRVLQTETISLKEVMSLHFGELDEYGYGVTVCSVTGSGLQLPPAPRPEPRDDDGHGDQGPADGHPTPFGGERNPNNMIFVFDATYCPANGLLGVALSDGSLRLVNGRGVCVSIINLPGCQSHLTSFSWDSTGTRLATCVATGHLISWELDISDADSGIAATCKAIMEGGKLLLLQIFVLRHSCCLFGPHLFSPACSGHQMGRPLFGCRYCGTNEDLLISWGVDGSLCLWDSWGHGNVQSPISVLRSDGEYPIYAVEITNDCIGVGGGSEGGFMGVPVFLYNVQGAKTNGPPAAMMVKANNTHATEQQTSCKHSAADSKPIQDAKSGTKPPPDKKIKIDSATTDEAAKAEVSSEAKES